MQTVLQTLRDNCDIIFRPGFLGVTPGLEQSVVQCLGRGVVKALEPVRLLPCIGGICVGLGEAFKSACHSAQTGGQWGQPSTHSQPS